MDEVRSKTARPDPPPREESIRAMRDQAKVIRDHMGGQDKIGGHALVDLWRSSVGGVDVHAERTDQIDLGVDTDEEA